MKCRICGKKDQEMTLCTECDAKMVERVKSPSGRHWFCAFMAGIVGALVLLHVYFWIWG